MYTVLIPVGQVVGLSLHIRNDPVDVTILVDGNIVHQYYEIYSVNA